MTAANAGFPDQELPDAALPSTKLPKKELPDAGIPDAGLSFVAVNGSARANGTSAAALAVAREHLAENGVQLEVVHLAERRIEACRCGGCNSRTTPCPVDDDVADIVRVMTGADGIVYTVPVYGYGASSLMQTFIERAGVGRLRFDRPLTNKVGGVVVVGRRYAHEAVHAQMLHNLLLNRLIIPGSGFPATVRAGGPDTVTRDTEGMSAMLAMLDRMLALAEALRGRPIPVPRGVETRLGVLS
ncbi:flavodoxin family protein [Nocardiopsis metallicus]|uniref:Multimeric flavodoxin WrbA n=1 Tax=Nocardiopsis metallicus TaxID=179819 RepID=A0A840W8I4_9ACTN|nr:flavodoxin family protein [Nocardiopsis metallicus]MBB5489371.1 multimeric flavodoxin WrbA [Nocardiopsis metallicus]